MPLPRWSAWRAALFAVAIGAPNAVCAASWGDTGAYQQRAEAWLATQPPGTPISAFPLIDGTYKGVAETVSAQNATCPARRKGIITIGDRRLILPYQPTVTFVAPVQPDGAVIARLTAAATTAQGRNATRARRAAPPVVIGNLDGRIGGGWLEFTVQTPSCETRYKLRWVM